MTAPLVLMTAGGTGGHVYPAMAVASELLARGLRVEWVGTARGLEHRVVPEAGITLHCLPVRGVRGKSVIDKVAALWFLALASVQAFWLLYRRAPSCVVGMGGYVAGPAGVAAWLLRKPLLIHEQNAVAGTTNRMLAPLANQVVAAFPGAFKEQIEITVLGNPVRRQLVEAGNGRSYDYADQRPLRLLVLGGSLGAQALNEVLPQAIPLLPLEMRPAIWHQTGQNKDTATRQAYADVHVEARVEPFIVDMAEAYSWADLVICRAGALTISELAAAGIGAILVPYPHAVDDHQTRNALYLTEAGAARLIPQSELTPDLLANVLRELLSGGREGLVEMAAAARRLAKPDAARQVAETCLEVMHG